MKETMIAAEVTYTLERGGRFYIIEHVPARVCRETGEQFFSLLLLGAKLIHPKTRHTAISLPNESPHELA